MTSSYLGTSTETVFGGTLCTFTTHKCSCVREKTKVLSLQNDEKPLTALNRLEAEVCACCICAYTSLYSLIQAHTGTYINLSNKVWVLKAWSWPQELRNWICELLNVRADLWEFEEGWCGEGQASGHVLYKKFNCSG